MAKSGSSWFGIENTGGPHKVAIVVRADTMCFQLERLIKIIVKA
jgi:hypothetical protein